MIEATSTQVKNKLGDYIYKAQKEPVIVLSHGRKQAVLISYDMFLELGGNDDGK